MFLPDPHNDATGAEVKVELPEPLVALRDALDDVRDLDVSSLSPAELRVAVADLCAAQSRLEAARLGAIAQLDSSLAWVGVGALSAGSWLARHTPLDAHQGRRDARVAKRLRDTPGTRSALQDGMLSPGAAGDLADGAIADPAAFACVEDAIVEAAKVCDRSRVRQALKLWDEQVRGQDRVAADLERQHQRRGVSASQSLDGMVFLEGTYDPVDGAEVLAILHAKEQHLYHQDRDNPAADPRTARQRRADALLELLRAGAGSFARGDDGPVVPGCATSTTVVIRDEHLRGLRDLLQAVQHAKAQTANDDISDGDTSSDDAHIGDDTNGRGGNNTSSDADRGSGSGRSGAHGGGGHSGDARAGDDTSATDRSDGTKHEVAKHEGAKGDDRDGDNNDADASGADTNSDDHNDPSEAPTVPARSAALRLPDVAANQTPATANAVPVTLNGRDQVLDPNTLSYLLCDTKIASLIVGPHDIPLDLGREQRTANRAQRRALKARDKRCIFAGCDRPAHWCDAHHIEYWDNGGATNLRNLALLCRAHHRLIHKPGWKIHIDHDGHPTITYHGIPQPRNTHPPPFASAA